MAIFNDRAKVSEASPLLGNDVVKSVDGQQGGVIEYGATNGYSGEGSSDEEAGEVEDVNPIFEGRPEMATRLHYLIPAVGIGIFLSAADQTIIVSSYGRIGTELNALNSTSWIATGYLLTVTTFQPLYGKLSDIFGRKPALLFGYIVFGLGCILCGLARSMPELIAARALAGIGGGGMTTVVSILMSDIIPLRERGAWQGYINIIFATGAASGAPLGGILADSIGWRYAFIGQGPICFVAFVAVYFILDLPKVDDTNWRQKLARVDFLGAIMLIAATSSLLIGLDNGSNVGWDNNFTISCLGASIPLYIMFLLVEMKVAANPFAPGRVIFDRSLFAAYMCNFFAMAGNMAVLFYLPLFLQAVDGLSSTQAGIRLIPGIIAGVSGSVGGGLIMQKTGKYYWLTIAGYSSVLFGDIIVFLFSGVLYNMSWIIILGMVFCSLGGGTGVTTSLIALIANAAPADQAVVTACSYLFRSLGSVLGVSLGATVVQQTLRTQLRRSLEDGDEADQIVEKVRQSLDFIKELSPATKAIVIRCYQMAISNAFGMALVIVSGAVVSAFFIREKKLSR